MTQKSAKRTAADTSRRSHCQQMTQSENDSYIARRADNNDITHNIRSRNVRVIKKRLQNQDMSTYRLCDAHRRMLNVHRKVYII